MSHSTVDADHASLDEREIIRVRQIVPLFAPAGAGPTAINLDARAVQIGREPAGEVALRLDDDEVSRLHATVTLDAERDVWSIVDGGSRNGTHVDGARIDRAELRHGSVLRVGRSLLLFLDMELSPGASFAPETPALRGHSIAMQRLRSELALVAPRDLPVLVLGETGVGKENVAAEIHRLSGRKGPFVPVNCASIPATLAESMLFGHAAGAFTGATGKAEGLFASAEGGTLFLDELGELPAEIQPKLLRALSTGEIRAVGRAETKRVNVRIVAATHRDVARQVAEDSFRADLFARLSAWPLRVPPLRARKEDVLRLARALLDRHGHDVSLAASAAEALLLFDWPFNVRELEQVVVAAAIRAGSGRRIRLEHLPDAISSRVGARESRRRRAPMTGPAPLPLELVVAPGRAPSREDLARVLAHFDGNLAQVATFFGKDRKQVYRWMDRHGLARRDPVDEAPASGSEEGQE